MATPSTTPLKTHAKSLRFGKPLYASKPIKPPAKAPSNIAALAFSLNPALTELSSFAFKVFKLCSFVNWEFIRFSSQSNDR